MNWEKLRDYCQARLEGKEVRLYINNVCCDLDECFLVNPDGLSQSLSDKDVRIDVITPRREVNGEFVPAPLDYEPEAGQKVWAVDPSTKSCIREIIYDCDFQAHQRFFNRDNIFATRDDALKNAKAMFGEYCS